MDNWKDLFYDRILERGKAYYEEGMVRQVTRTAAGYHAFVDGSEIYEVEIEMDGDSVCDMTCTCPFAEEGTYCKHMAAVLYEIDSGDYKEKSAYRMRRTERIVSADKELEDTIALIPEKELRSFVKRIAKGDAEIKNLLLTKYLPQIDERLVEKLLKELDDMIYRYGGSQQYVNYTNARKFIYALRMFLKDKVQVLVDRKYYMQAFELTNYVFEIIGNIVMDDSDGRSEQIADACYDMWKDILDGCSEGEKKKMHDWFEEHRSGGFVVDYMEEYLDDFLRDEFG